MELLTTLVVLVAFHLFCGAVTWIALDKYSAGYHHYESYSVQKNFTKAVILGGVLSMLLFIGVLFFGLYLGYKGENYKKD